MSGLAERLEATARAMATTLESLIPAATAPQDRLTDAMRYASLNGGKRLRPFLVMESAGLFDVPDAQATRAAAAVEFIHCYSLVHDDLPAMDDDDLRRGQPTTHIAFDEATAILAGDALLTLAFEVLADPRTAPDGDIRCALVGALARAAGAAGMVGGQMIDLAAEHTAQDLPAITRLQQLKTGALIRFSCEAGGILGCATADQTRALRRYAEDLGLAFQIADDLLDVEGDVSTVGKGVGKDAAAGKATFVSLLGVEAARRKARELARSAAAHLQPFGARADLLRAAAEFVVDREH